MPVAKTAPAYSDRSAGQNKHSAPLPDSPEARVTADAQVANAFARALATHSYQTSIRAPNVQVPPESTLGRWRTELDSAFKGLGFQAWAKAQGLDTTSITLDPARGELTGALGGKTYTFSLKDDSGWSDVSRVLLSIAKAIAPESGQPFNYPWPDGEVPLNTVGRFYQEPIDLSPAQATLHRKKLQRGSAFEFKPVAHASLRSAAALAEQQTARGDDANRHALITALRFRVDDAHGKIDLDKVTIPIEPRSGLFASEQRLEMSVAQILKLEGVKVPVNSAQALEVAEALSFDLAHRAPGVDAGGVKSLVGLLGATSCRKMQAVTDGWKRQRLTQAPNIRAEEGAGSLLSHLISVLPQATKKLIKDSPSTVLDQLIRLPEARELGKDIQNKLKIIETPTSAVESVAAALVHELNPGAGQSRFNLAGYKLYSEDNSGFSPADIVKRFIVHLEGRVGAEAAPLAARLLLLAAAPEFLVADTPPNLVYGSHTWANFCIEVSRIEQQVPGASANMTFSQVMAFGDTPPISLEGEDQLSAAARDPIIAWGIANAVLSARPDQDYSIADVQHSQKLLNEQIQELAWAKDALQKKAPTRREVALAELKRVFPGIDPTLNILQAPWVKHDPVSLLDIYMTGPIKPDDWLSLDEKKFPYSVLRSRFSELAPDINLVFSDKFKVFKKIHESAWAVNVKYHISLLPVAEREHIKHADVSFIEVSRPFLGTELEPGSKWYPGRRPRKPTAQELEGLKGKHGVLMKAEGRDGKVRYYSYFPALGKIIKEEGFPGEKTNANDSAYFGGSTQDRVSGTHNVYNQYGAVNKDRDPDESPGNRQGSYSSVRNGAMASVAAGFFTRDYDALKFNAAGVTALEKGKAYDEKLKGFFLSLVPFYDGIQDAIKGNVAGAVFNIGFDILGFFLPGISAARKAANAGRGTLNVIKSGLFAGMGASVGATDALQITNNLNRGAKAGYKDVRYLIAHGDEVLSRLKGNYRSYDFATIYKDGDVVKGFYRSQENHLIYSTVAVLKKGTWYAYNVVTNTPFGAQLAQFGVVTALQSVLSKKPLPVEPITPVSFAD